MEGRMLRRRDGVLSDAYSLRVLDLGLMKALIEGIEIEGTPKEVIELLRLKKTDLKPEEATRRSRNDYCAMLESFLNDFDESILEVEYEDTGRTPSNVASSINRCIAAHGNQFKGLVAFSANKRVFITFGDQLPEGTAAKAKFDKMNKA